MSNESTDANGTDNAADPVDAVVLIHGFLDSQAGWAQLAKVLQARTSASIVTPDLRGAGSLRNVGGPYTLEQATFDVLNLIVQRRYRRIALIGHSMGAQVAELVAQKVPKLTAALVLVTPTPLGGNALPDEVRTLLRTSGGDGTAQRGIRTAFSCNLNEDQLDMLVAPATLMEKEAVEGYYDAFSKGHASGSAPCTFHGPTLLIAAKDDPVIPVAMVESIRDQRFSGAQMIQIDGSGHWPQLERAKETGNSIAAFLNARVRQ
ncbi:alpha/beta fold hydrolase [Cupriavidus basilensis]